MSSFKEHKDYWADIAKRHDWQKPAHVIVMYDRDGLIKDSVSIDGLDRDIAVFDR
jgi:hypothetical protein